MCCKHTHLHPHGGKVFGWKFTDSQSAREGSLSGPTIAQQHHLKGR
jgi:hypothetical protein